MPTISAIPRFQYHASSANIDFYRSNGYYAEVLVDALVKVNGEYAVRRPARFHVKVVQTRKRPFGEVTRFTYEPRTPVPGNRLADRTVTKLIRDYLKERS